MVQMGKHLSSVSVAKTMLAKRRALAKPSATESHFESKPKWNQDGTRMACSWESWDLSARRFVVQESLKTRVTQVQDYEQQSGDKISDAIKLGVVPHHLPDASLREHLLLNSRVYDTYALMAAEIRTVAMARTAWSGPTPCGSEHTREGCCLSRVREERTLCEGLLVSNKQRKWERKERQKWHETQERPRERHKTQGW